MTKSLKSIAWLLVLCLMLWLVSPLVPSYAAPGDETQTEETADEETSGEESEDEEAEKKAEKIKNEDGLELPELNCPILLIKDRDSGKILYSRKADKKAEPASLTKIMTVLLAVEAIEAGEVNEKEKVTVSKHCMDGIEEESSTSGIVAGEKITFIDLLYCAMLPSAGEACNVIAERLSEDIESFVEKMNDRASELGCTDTHFVNAHGMPADDHYSTASDMALITEEAMQHELFRTIAATPSYTLEATNKNEEREVYNSNALISSRGIYGGNFIYEKATGVKTGHTTAAGYCLSSTASNDDLNLLCIAMGGGTSIRDDMATNFHNFSDTIALYNWAFENYHHEVLISSEDLVSEITLKYAPADNSTVTLHPEGDVVALLPSNVDPEQFERNVTFFNDSPAAPVEEGEAMGEITVSYAGQVYAKANLLTTSAVELSRGQYLKATLWKTLGRPWVLILFLVVLLLALLYFAAVVNYRKKRQQQLQKKRQQQRTQVQQKTRQAEERARASAQRGKMREYDRDGNPKDPYADKHDYFEEFFRNEEKQNRMRRK